MIKTVLITVVALAIGISICGRTRDLSTAKASLPEVAARDDHVIGDYVEARTAAVFAGACHYCGEAVTTGHEAVMAWNFTGGSWDHVDLAGVRMMAAITCGDNLGESGANRKMELLVDASASEAQVKAVTAMLQSRCAASRVEIVNVERGPIRFAHEGKNYIVAAEGFAQLVVTAMPNDECCAQPQMVWYTPLFPLTRPKVGYTQAAAYAAGTLGDRWQRGDENSAFYGAFSY